MFQPKEEWVKKDFKGSSILDVAYHDLKARTLYITFHDGSTYVYADVSFEEFKVFCDAPSAGSHFHKHIKTKKNKLIDDGGES